MANKIQDAFDGIQADTQLKESTKQFLREEYAKRSQPANHKPYRKLLAAACLFVFLLTGAAGYAWVQAPIAYVSIDINPSIELALNRLDRVVSATAYNTQGEKILNSLKLNGKKYTAAVDIIIGSREMTVYLEKESELVFTIAADNGHYLKLRKGVERCSGHIGYESHSVHADAGLLTTAHESGLSLGKYYAWQQLVQYDASVTADECEDMSMSKIHGLIQEHEQDNDCSQGNKHRQDNESQQNNGHSQQQDEPQQDQTEQPPADTDESAADPDISPSENQHHKESCHH